MRFSLLFAFVIVVGIYSYNFSEASEPVCSKFAYEEQLLEKMIRTEIKVETMVNEINKTEENVISTLGDIKQTVADLTGNITYEMLQKSDEIKRREGSFKNLFDETSKNLTSDMEAKREELTQLQEKLERPPIAFHAHYLTDFVLDTRDEIIIFTKSLINEGTGYDTSTGIFTAPVGGLYQFIVHTCTYYAKYAHIGLVWEDKVIAAGLNYDKDYDTCSTVGAIVRVRSGEKIWVKVTSSGSNRQLYQDSNTMNTFSGVLVNN
ncbi:complement C1q and tumor necrosis factor-related protein 9A-like isoform X3 [Ruditapes philippinarum]|uniref:complement C1q and tumor necrosis factor-related protein 9A-like isoform X3 n=1 Tax=Ruditapes philippinarum TaxID=129788 RepID=UPI00295C153B|nr:complement C1q and tumor necrosis factor-related protein 9A-like isoform X3 [Ruditapes philippinarum]